MQDDEERVACLRVLRAVFVDPDRITAERGNATGRFVDERWRCSRTRSLASVRVAGAESVHIDEARCPGKMPQPPTPILLPGFLSSQ